MPARRHADGAADDARLGERRVVDAVAAEGALQPVGHLEHAALAGHAFERRLAAAVGNVFAEDDDARVALHLVLQRAVDRRDHRVRLAFGNGRALEFRRRRIDVWRIDEQLDGVADWASRPSWRVPRRRSLHARPLRRSTRARTRWRAPPPRGSPPAAQSGSRLASAARSSGVLYNRSSSDNEWEYGRITLAWMNAGPLRARRVRDGLLHGGVACQVIGAVDALDQQPGEG